MRRPPPPTAWFLPLPEHGHILPTLKLARRLVADGWQVVYITDSKFAPLLSRNGFQFVESPHHDGGDTRSADRKRLRRANRRNTAQNRDYMSNYRAERDLVRTLKPSAVFIDVFRGSFCYVPVAECVPAISYHICRDAETSGAPPLIRGYGAPRGPVSRARLRADWLYLWQLRQLWREFQDGRFARARRRAVEEEFRRRGLPLRPSSMSVFGYDVNTTVLGPVALSMRSLPADRYFGFGLLEDAGGAGDGAAEFPKFAKELPVVYCSFGSMSARHGEAYPIFNDIVEVFAAQGKFNLIVQAGKFADDLSDRGAGNVRVVNFAPQVAYLKRASVAITHGGYGTVKECVASEVPMLAIPFWQDQFGNAQMLKRLGIGETLGRKRFDARKAHLRVESLAADPQARVRLRALYSREQDDAEFERAYASLLGRIGSPAPMPLTA